MELSKFDEINRKLKDALKHSRYIHTLGVAFTASSMAMAHGYDHDRALLAGLLHDCAKCFPDDEKISLCREGGVKLSQIELNNPSLIHAKLGVYIARRDYGVDDSEILEAIRTHTTGEPDMTLLQKIIYVADMVEPNRDDEIPDMPLMRSLAFSDLDEAMYVISDRMLNYLKGNPNKEVDPMSRQVYDFYKEIHDRKQIVHTY